MKEIVFTREQLAVAAKNSGSYRDMLLLLGVSGGGTSYIWLKKQIGCHSIDTQHFFPYSEENFKKLCKSSITIAEVLEKLGLTNYAGNHAVIRRKVLEYGVDIEHWTGQYKKRKEKKSRKGKMALEDILVENSSYSSSRLLIRLVEEKSWKKQCFFDNCPTRSMKKWRGDEISFELDHINGISSDHRIKNLRILCIMCHKKTKTYGGKNRSIIKKPPKPICLSCGKPVFKYGASCIDCFNKSGKNKGGRKTKINWPEPEVLLKLVNTNGLSAVARDFKCVPNSVKK